MQFGEIVRLSSLFDLYGALLSESQQDILNDYLLLNLTNSEIAENRGVTRQAVKDALDTGIKKLNFYEEKLGFSNRIMAYENKILELEMQSKGRKK